MMDSRKVSKIAILKASGITRPTLENALSGGDMRVSTLESLSAALGVSPAVFWSEEDLDMETLRAKGKTFVPKNSVMEETYKEKIAYLERILEEKERLISVLMGERGVIEQSN